MPYSSLWDSLLLKASVQSLPTDPHGRWVGCQLATRVTDPSVVSPLNPQHLSASLSLRCACASPHLRCLPRRQLIGVLFIPRCQPGGSQNRPDLAQRRWWNLRPVAPASSSRLVLKRARNAQPTLAQLYADPALRAEEFPEFCHHETLRGRDSRLRSIG